MNTQNDPAHTETVRERDVVVTDNGRSSGAATMVIALVAIAALALVGFFVLNTESGDSVVPDEINVNVDDSTGSDGGSTDDSGSSDSGSTDADA